MRSAFQGDPYIVMTQDGATLSFVEGQPITDQGFENAVLISLFTRRGWVGNDLFDQLDQQIGSDFEDSMKLALNLEGLNRRRQAAESALSWLVNQGRVRDIEVNVTNPNSNIIIVSIRIFPPFGESVDLTLENFGASWRFQRDSPANGRV